ncbi:Rgp1-domain-containing protein [Blastocladiella britannica]|nr:Rgp1-domain-containing protein [Blastocladiella britannica]
MTTRSLPIVSVAIADNGIVAAGEVLRLTVTLTGDSQSNVDIMLATVQLVGALQLDPAAVSSTINPTKVNILAPDLLLPGELPVLVSPKSVLLVSTTLAPNHSRTLECAFLLPAVLPPTVRGCRHVKIGYRAVVDVRTSPTRGPPAARVALPFRVFGAVDADSRPVNYDIARPVPVPSDHAVVWEALSAPESGTVARAKTPTELRDYLHQLQALLLVDVASTENGPGTRSTTPNAAPVSNEPKVAASWLRSPQNGRLARSVADQCRRSPAVVFDIAHGDDRVAKVRLVRSSFRIGDSIVGTIDLTSARIATYRMSVILEAQESVSPTASKVPGTTIVHIKQIDQVHAFVHGSSLVPFELRVAPSCTPAFTTSAVSLVYQLRVEILMRPAGTADSSAYMLGVVATEHSASLVARPTLDGQTLTCVLPLNLLPGPGGGVSGMYPLTASSTIKIDPPPR